MFLTFTEKYKTAFGIDEKVPNYGRDRFFFFPQTTTIPIKQDEIKGSLFWVCFGTVQLPNFIFISPILRQPNVRKKARFKNNFLDSEASDLG